MSVMPAAQKTGWRSSTQLSAAVVEVFLGTGLELASSHWSECVSAIIYRPVIISHSVFATGVAFLIGIIFGTI